MSSGGAVSTQREQRVGRRLAVFCLLAALASSAAFAEIWNLRFDTIGGLSQSEVTTITQDHRGFLWIGTQDGLNRWDGYRSKVFSNQDTEADSLPHDNIRVVFEDAQQRLWIGTEGGGLARLNRDGLTFTAYPFKGEKKEATEGTRIRDITQAPSGEIWVATETAGVYRLDERLRAFHGYSADPKDPGSISSSLVRTILIDSRGDFWVGTDEGLDRFDSETDSFVHYLHDPEDPHSVSGNSIYSLLEDDQGHIWVGTKDHGLNRLDVSTGRFRHYTADPENPKEKFRAREIFQDAFGNIWIGSDSGLSRVNQETGEFRTFDHDPSDTSSLAANRVRVIYQDRGGVLWVGTSGGLSRWNPATRQFGHTRVPDGSHVQSLTTDRSGKIWIGTLGGGLFGFDLATGSYTDHITDSGEPGKRLADNRVMALLETRDGFLYAATLASGLNRINLESRQIENWSHDPDDLESLSKNAITCLLEDRQGSLWVGTFRGGLNRFDQKSKKFTRFQHDPQDPTSLGDGRVVALHQDRAGYLWIGSDGGGLSRFDPKSETFETYRHDPSNPSGLSGNVIFSIHEDRAGSLWLAVRGEGLDVWSAEDRKAGKVRFDRVKERDGLPNDVIYGILEDDAGNLWLSHHKGLTRYNPIVRSFRTLHQEDGLQADEFNFGAYHRSASGVMLFGGQKGFNAFDPDSIRVNNFQPPIMLTNYLVFNEPVVSAVDVSYLDSVVLTHEDSFVTFEVASLDFSNPEKNRYRYKLEGLFSESWFELDDSRRITYTNLDPGRYTLKVEGSNSDGKFSPEALEVALLVKPAPWRSWWAYLLYGAISLSVIFGYVRSQSEARKREAEYTTRLEEEVKERTRELAERYIQLEQLNKSLQEASLRDTLTGVRNRRYLSDYIERDIALIDRYYTPESGADPSALKPQQLFLMIDLDGFKKINDTFGHAVGDRTLLKLRDVLQGACREADTLVRWGGDEFVIVGRELQPGTVQGLAERVCRAVEAADLGPQSDFRVTCSIGFAKYPFLPWDPKALGWEQVLTIADRALYAAKTSGKNTWVGIVSNPKTQGEDLQRRIQEEPEEMLRQNQLTVHSSLSRPDELNWS